MRFRLLLVFNFAICCVVFAERKTNTHVVRVSDKAFGKEFDLPKTAPRARRLKGTGRQQNDYDYGIGNHADEYDQEIRHRKNKDLFRDKAGPLDNFDNFNFEDESDDHDRETPSLKSGRSSDDFMENARFSDIRSRSNSRSREIKSFN